MRKFTSDEPDLVAPTTRSLSASDSPFVDGFPAASVTKLEIELGA